LHFLQSVPEKALVSHGISKEQWTKQIAEIRLNFRQKQMKQEDAVLFFLLMRRTFPVTITQKARYVFIDEMQDFAPSQVALLQALYPKANLTFCGDLNQNVFGNETIVGSLPQLFDNQEVTRFQLTTSYRSTKEITDFANHFLSKEDRVETTARKGDKPVIIEASTAEKQLHWFEETLEQTQAKAKHWRTAIIAKTQEECEQ
ncbi:AAA family ATPase, partial [Vibrio parahaemolyticus]|nr:AAA family ATPase [Vibrio parahaemolyticus]